ncbi:MAG: ABC transporter substrate-binding protein [Actinobacteria bacterium]|nr:ABC transporter substrate-binding protein [Actinomycetota bacterium]
MNSARLRNTRLRNRSTRAVLVLAVCIALVAGACGGGDDESAPAGGAAPGTKATTIRLGFSAWPGWFPWQVAEEKGLFTKAGLDVKLTYFESYTDSLNALNAGKLDANSQTLNDTISSVAGGAKQAVVLANDNSTGNDQIIVKPGIQSVTDLKGKKVGVEEGTVDHFLLLLGLQKAGLKPGDIQLQPLVTDAAASAFAAGQLDAVGVFAPFSTKALELPGSKALFTSADFPGSIPDHLVFGKSFVDAHPGEVQKLVDAWFDTIAYIAQNREETTAIMAKRAGVTVGEYSDYEKGTRIFSRAENQAAFEPGSDMSHLDFAARSMATFLLDAKLIDAKPDLAGLLDRRFVAGTRTP